MDINILIFNNKIYGLAKGQYSPTSDRGTVSKSESLREQWRIPSSPPSFASGARQLLRPQLRREPRDHPRVHWWPPRHKGTAVLRCSRTASSSTTASLMRFVDKENRAPHHHPPPRREDAFRQGRQQGAGSGWFRTQGRDCPERTATPSTMCSCMTHTAARTSCSSSLP